MSLPQETISAAEASATAIDAKKGLGITVLDVSRLIVVTDVFIIATGTSRRHVLTLAEAAEEGMAESGRKVLRREGWEDAKWVLLDFGDLVVHVFDQFTRDFYDLERLWSDAPRLAAAVSAP